MGFLFTCKKNVCANRSGSFNPVLKQAINNNKIRIENFEVFHQLLDRVFEPALAYFDQQGEKTPIRTRSCDELELSTSVKDN